jgi:hypothetical protein
VGGYAFQGGFSGEARVTRLRPSRHASFSVSITELVPHLGETLDRRNETLKCLSVDDLMLNRIEFHGCLQADHLDS